MDHPDGIPGRDVLRRMWELEPPTEYESGFYPSTPKEMRGTIATRFYTVNCVKAGWMTKSAGAWRVTDEGRRAYEEFSDPAAFARESTRQYQEWKAQQQGEARDVDVDSSDGDTATPEVVASTTLEVAREDAWLEIRRFITTMDPYEFQNLIAALLRAMGYHIAHISPPGPDRGLDVLAFTDPLGAQGPRIKVQVKRRADKATVQSVREFLSILGDNDVGLFISSGGFTSEAESEARFQEKRRITLVDLEKLVELWVSHIEDARDVDRQLLPLEPIWFLSVET
jgi:restriction system protein